MLHDQPVAPLSYRRVEALRVRLEEGKIQCFVNDQLVIESSDDGLTGGKVGLAKFRQTKADFRNFAWGERLRRAPSRQKIKNGVAKLTESLGRPAVAGCGTARFAEGQARRKYAIAPRAGSPARWAVGAALRRLAETVHQQRVTRGAAGRTGAKRGQARLVSCGAAAVEAR